MYRPPEPWTGRVDDEGPAALRWHQAVQTTPGDGGITLIGFACEAGVLRNHGRAGAAEGPPAIRRALTNLAWHQQGVVHDDGDVACEGDALEQAQDELAWRVKGALTRGSTTIVLGGGHEVAWGSFQGLAAATSERIGVINLDAHFDVRTSTRGSSGTPFRQIMTSGRAREYLCLGVNEDANTGALYDTMRDLGGSWLEDHELTRPEPARTAIDAMLQRVDRIHLSIDLDVLPASVAPGVSAPAARGVSLDVIEALALHIARSGKMALVDIAELNPRLDLDGRTARVAARLVARIARALPLIG